MSGLPTPGEKRYEYIWNVLEHEGGFSDSKSDRGGKTFRGITWKSYRYWCKKIGAIPKASHHSSLSDEEVLSFYISIFVQPYNIENYRHDWTREAMFSASIMHGGAPAAVMAQKTVNDISRDKLKADGIPGELTMAAVNVIPAVIFVNNLSIRRVIFVDRLVQRTVSRGDPLQANNLVGWHNRFLRFIKPTELFYDKDSNNDGFTTRGRLQ